MVIVWENAPNERNKGMPTQHVVNHYTVQIPDIYWHSFANNAKFNYLSALPVSIRAFCTLTPGYGTWTPECVVTRPSETR